MPNVNLDSIRSAIETLAYVREQTASLRKIEDAAKAQITAAMGGNDVGEVDGLPVITINRYKKRKFNQKALEAERPEIFAEYLEQVEQANINIVKED